MAKQNYYSVLGVNKEASEKEIKQAYRKLARKFHPDVNPGDKAAESQFKKVNEAYEVLSNKENRKKYDQFGDQWQYVDHFNQGNGQPGSRFWNFSQGGNNAQGFSSYEDAGLGDIFENLFGNTGRRSRRPRRGQDAEFPVEVSLEEAYSGTARTIALQAQDGSGTRRLEVKIPAGVKDGSRVRIGGQGGPGMGGGASGDLYLKVSVKPNSHFERYGDNLHTDISVPLTVAVLGGEVQVNTLKGKVMLKIPPETQNGRVFRLTGQGMPHLGNSSRGDLLAKVMVELPMKLTGEEKSLFEKLSQIRSDS